MELESIYSQLRLAARKLEIQSAQQKNSALKNVVEALKQNENAILQANQKDIEIARKNGMKESLVERLALDVKKMQGMYQSLETVIAQTDPVGEEIAGWKTPNGMEIRQVRVPLGVVAIIYESRPNVTVDAFCLAYKSGNSILLRGSSSALNSNKALVSVIKEALQKDFGIPEAIALVEPEGKSHEDVNQILTATGKIDVVLPRGGANLIRTVVENAKVPVIETGSGVCHLFVDKDANVEMAAKIAENAKIQRPGACNAIECILVHKDIAKEFLPVLSKKLAGRVQLKADSESFKILSASGEKNLVQAAEEDFGFEFLDLICAVKITDSLESAIEYINTHNTKHSECIVTNNRSNAREFQARIDAACVYVNSSTRFTDGGEFGFGAELGISTQKLHARGPMGIKALTTTKYLIDGDGQVR